MFDGAARPVRRAAWVAIIGLTASCHRGGERLYVTAPFNDEVRIADVTAEWRSVPGGDDAAEDHLSFAVHVENRLADRLYVRLEGLALLDAAGKPLAAPPEERGCVVAAKATATPLSGMVDVAPAGAAAITSFRVHRFGVPLSERGRGIYREFLLQSQKFTAAEVDAEIDGYLRSPDCP